jgi:hypothetical protein
LVTALVERGEAFRGQAVLAGTVAPKRCHHASRFLAALPVLALKPFAGASRPAQLICKYVNVKSVHTGLAFPSIMKGR